jgi:hypothetical protein
VLRALATLEGEYLASVAAGGFGSAPLFRLGALAGDLFAASRGPNSLLAYVLRSIFLDLARHLEGEPVSVELTNALFDALTGPVEAAINGLKGPITEEMAAHLALRLLEAPRLFTPSVQTH